MTAGAAMYLAAPAGRSRSFTWFSILLTGFHSLVLQMPRPPFGSRITLTEARN
jgi:hypothetical protein